MHPLCLNMIWGCNWQTHVWASSNSETNMIISSGFLFVPFFSEGSPFSLSPSTIPLYMWLILLFWKLNLKVRKLCILLKINFQKGSYIVLKVVLKFYHFPNIIYGMIILNKCKKKRTKIEKKSNEEMCLEKKSVQNVMALCRISDHWRCKSI